MKLETELGSGRINYIFTITLFFKTTQLQKSKHLSLNGFARAGFFQSQKALFNPLHFLPIEENKWMQGMPWLKLEMSLSP